MRDDLVDLSIANLPKWKQAQYKPVLASYNYCCAVCGEDNLFALQHDHVTPRTKGGEDEPENYQTLCGPCNNVKGNIAGMERIPPRLPETDTAKKMAAHIAFRAACKAAKG